MPGIYTLKTESCYDANFVVDGSTECDCYDIAQSRQYWRGWHHGNFLVSVYGNLTYMYKSYNYRISTWTYASYNIINARTIMITCNTINV